MSQDIVRNAEVESALVLHKKVSEVMVVGYPHDIKGQEYMLMLLS